MEKLKFKQNINQPMGISEDFFYMISGGGWLKPERFLEEDDAKRVREAIDLIEQYQEQGMKEGYFEEC